MSKEYDFGGWATRFGIKCSDGRVISHGAFKGDNGKKVPLVWNHDRNNAGNVLGHAILEDRDSGVYAYCSFNDTADARKAKTLVEHGDITALSINANNLQQAGSEVRHGVIREVSMVLAGANPGAYIDDIMEHSDGDSFSAIIYNEDEELSHGDVSNEEKGDAKKVDKNAIMEALGHLSEDERQSVLESVGLDHADGNDLTVADVWDTFNEDQQKVVYYLIAQAVEDAQEGDDEYDEGDEDMRHSIFDAETQEEKAVLKHSDQVNILKEGKRLGSLRDAWNEFTATNEELSHGITDIETLFPEAKTATPAPEWIKRDTGWVANVMANVSKSPFSRIKSMFADLTEEEARAKGYIKGKQKLEQVFSLLKRTTTPQTVYKTQKLDRDDVIDITDFDVVVWIKSEMRGMLDEEIARAMFIGDGRLSSSDDKIQEVNIRPIAKDEALYAINVQITKDSDGAVMANEFIEKAIKNRKKYKGSGNPTAYMTEDLLAECLLLKDRNGRFIYESIEQLARTLRVKEIITVPVMDEATGTGKNGGDVLGIIVNLTDYKIGADKGGQVTLFDDFDIDYNKQKYLIETRISGALVKPYSAMVFEAVTTPSGGGGGQ